MIEKRKKRTDFPRFLHHWRFFVLPRNGGNFLLPDVFPTMSGPNPVLISGLRCNGNESSIKECELLKLKDHDCAGGVGLQCYVGGLYTYSSNLINYRFKSSVI